MSELKSSIEAKLDSIKTMAQTKPGEYLEGVKDELFDLKEKYLVSREDHDRLAGVRDFFQRDMIRSNPGMTSTKFKEPLDELKEHAVRKKKERKTEDEEN